MRIIKIRKHVSTLLVCIRELAGLDVGLGNDSDARMPPQQRAGLRYRDTKTIISRAFVGLKTPPDPNPGGGCVPAAGIEMQV